MAVLADDGPGIAPELQSRVFEPFFTTQAQGQGTGLGLSHVHAIVQDHGGWIRLDSSAQGGARFTIGIPLQSGVQSKAVVEQAVDGSGDVEPMLVLIADDELSIQLLVSRVLDALGHRYHTASTGMEALELASQHDYDLLVADFRMPGMDGPRLHRALTQENPELARACACTLVRNDNSTL